MRYSKLVVGLFASMVAVVQTSASNAADGNARDILVKSENAQRFKDLTTVATLTTDDGKGDVRSKTFTMFRKLSADNVHFAVVTRFTAPAEVRGEAILFEERASNENDVQLYLPRFKKVRRVEALSQSSSFMGSTLNYSDITTPHVDDYRSKWLRQEPCPPDPHSTCALLELLPASDAVLERTGYSKSMQWLRLDNSMPVQSDLYDRGGKLRKRMICSDIREVDSAGHKFFAHSLRVDDLATHRSTTISFSQVKANVGLADSMFTTQGIAREN